MKTIATLTLLLAAAAAHAQNTPVGLWKTIDDTSHKEKSLVRIAESGGVLSGTIEKLLDPATMADAVCEKCTDERKDKPIVGLRIIEGLKKTGEGEIWDGGHILDPNNGKIYRVRLTPIDGGKQLEMRGYIGPFFRTQTWSRVE